MKILEFQGMTWKNVFRIAHFYARKISICAIEFYSSLWSVRQGWHHHRLLVFNICPILFKVIFSKTVCQPRSFPLLQLLDVLFDFKTFILIVHLSKSVHALLGFTNRVQITNFLHDRSTVHVVESRCAQCLDHFVPNSIFLIASIFVLDRVGS